METNALWGNLLQCLLSAQRFALGDLCATGSLPVLVTKTQGFPQDDIDTGKLLMLCNTVTHMYTRYG